MVERGGVRLVDSLNPRHTTAPKAERRPLPEAKAARAGLESARRLRLDSHVLAPAHEVLRGPEVRGDLVGPPGVSAKEVSEQMGHTSPEFTERVYVTLYDSAKREMSDTLEKLLSAGHGTQLAHNETDKVMQLAFNEPDRQKYSVLGYNTRQREQGKIRVRAVR